MESRCFAELVNVQQRRAAAAEQLAAIAAEFPDLFIEFAQKAIEVGDGRNRGPARVESAAHESAAHESVALSDSGRSSRQAGPILLDDPDLQFNLARLFQYFDDTDNTPRSLPRISQDTGISIPEIERVVKGIHEPGFRRENSHRRGPRYSLAPDLLNRLRYGEVADEDMMPVTEAIRWFVAENPGATSGQVVQGIYNRLKTRSNDKHNLIYGSLSNMERRGKLLVERTSDGNRYYVAGRAPR